MRLRPKNDRGYLTLTALCLTTIVGISLASYISLSYQSYVFSFRLFQLAQCRQLAETGLEEALWALNNNNSWSSAGPGSNVAWTTSSPPAGPTQTCTITGYQLGEGVTGQVAITVTNYNWQFASNPTSPMQAPSIVAIATVTLPTGGQFTKTLSAPFKPATLFPNAAGIANVNTGSIYFLTGGFADSWKSDAKNGTGTFAPYSDPYFVHPPTAGALPYTYAATFASPGSNPGTAMSLGAATIYGYAATFGSPVGATGSSVLKGPSSASNLDTTRVYLSAYVPNFPVAVPLSYTISGYLTGGNQSIVTGSPTTTEYWVASSGLTLNGATITVQGPVVMIVQGDLTLYNAGRIQLNSNSRLEIFVSGNVQVGLGVGSIAGFINGSTTGTANAADNDPKNLALYSTSTNFGRVFTYYSSLDFCGVIYSASRNSRLFFESSPNIYGAIMANFDIYFDTGTNPQIHYDQALQDLPVNWFKGITTPFVLLQITES